MTNQEGELINDPEKIGDLFRDNVELILNGGVLVSEPSTVLDLTDETPRVVRRGAGDVSFLQ